MTLKNPKRSGGPTSQEGKLIASKNSIQTGTYSNMVVLPGESQEEFNQLLDHCNHDFQPTDVIEKSLVREMVSLTWKKLRLEKLENDYFIKKLNAPITIEEFLDSGLNFDEDRFKFWVNQDQLDDAQQAKYTELVLIMKSHLNEGITVDILSQIKGLDPELYESIVAGYKHLNPGADDDVSDQQLVESIEWAAGQRGRYLTAAAFKNFLPFYEAGLWCAKNRQEISQAVVQVKQERLLKLMQSEGVRRANDDLTRSMVRVLGEFRKHNQWRLQHRVIDVEEK